MKRKRKETMCMLNLSGQVRITPMITFYVINIDNCYIYIEAYSASTDPAAAAVAAALESGPHANNIRRAVRCPFHLIEMEHYR